MTAQPATRNPRDTHLIHEHPTVQLFMKRRLGDGSTTHPHKMTWNYYTPRNRWEAVCELMDIVFYAPAVPDDVEFRKGRTL